MKYDFKTIEQKWQKYWSSHQTFKVLNDAQRPKFYVLDMFPYPSGAGLHVGHPLGYIASDIYARYKRHKGFQVLHPQGYDSFGLPAEQYAITTGQHPAITTQENIKTYRGQLDRLGFSFDWSREIKTSSPSYYKWTQWIFSLLFNSWYNKKEDKAAPIKTLISHFERFGTQDLEAVCDEDCSDFNADEWSQFSETRKQEILLNYRLTYLSETQVNWCPELGTVLANDEIVNGVSERGGHPVVRKKMKQWSMRITAYAQRLLEGLDKIDWPRPLKDSQTNWIGRSDGATVHYKIKGSNNSISVFTTRPDTIFGASFLTLAPEHDLVQEITTPDCQKNIEAYIKETEKRSDLERMADTKSISGAFTGRYALHPFTGKEIPIWISDYVLIGYGTGAVMAVPCGDQRDYDFAKHYALPIPSIFKNADISEKAHVEKTGTVIDHSDFLTNLPFIEAKEKAILALEENKSGCRKINYRIRDAVFSRQRYWGEPFPIYYKEGLPQIIDPKFYPIELPEVEKYLPTSDGKPPLGNAKKWAWCTSTHKVVDTDKINHKTIFPLELNTMPGWAGSSSYFNRYMDPLNNDEFVSPEAIDYWKNVDLYIGGSEHATGHLLYSRFWQKFLFDRGILPVDEYAEKLINQGMILGESALIHRVVGESKYVSESIAKDFSTQKIHVDIANLKSHNELDLQKLKSSKKEYEKAVFVCDTEGNFTVERLVEKMSKSKLNVVNPDAICEEHGADSLRMYEMFLGPLEQSKPWNTSGISGVSSFLKKLWKLFFKDAVFEVSDEAPTGDELKILHKTIQKVEQDIEAFSFNTSVSTFMIAVNELTKLKCNKRAILEPLVILMEPYAPHIAEELWEQLGHKGSIATVPFPVFNATYIQENKKEYPISFNGKLKFKLEFSVDESKDNIEKEVLNHPKTIQTLEGKPIKKLIIVPGKIVNIVF